MATGSSDVFRILTITPNLIQIEVLNANQFKQDADDFTIGSYLKISDDSNTAIIALVQSFRIKEISAGIDTQIPNPTFILDAQPIGFLDDGGSFRRGGKQIAIPPSSVEIASDDLLKKIYTSIEKEKEFCFSTLAHKPNIEIGVDGDKFFSKHIAVVGSTGSGKSGTVARILQEGIAPSSDQIKNGVLNNTHILLFDLHGEYKTAFPKSKKLDVENLVDSVTFMFQQGMTRTNLHPPIVLFRYPILRSM